MARWPAWRIAPVEQTGERTFGPKPGGASGQWLAPVRSVVDGGHRWGDDPEGHCRDLRGGCQQT